MLLERCVYYPGLRTQLRWTKSIPRFVFYNLKNIAVIRLFMYEQNGAAFCQALLNGVNTDSAWWINPWCNSFEYSAQPYVLVRKLQCSLTVCQWKCLCQTCQVKISNVHPSISYTSYRSVMVMGESHPSRHWKRGRKHPDILPAGLKSGDCEDNNQAKIWIIM